MFEMVTDHSWELPQPEIPHLGDDLLYAIIFFFPPFNYEDSAIFFFSLHFNNPTFLPQECDELQLEDMDEINISYVPQCLLSSLEFVDFNVPLSSVVGEMNMVRYILENSAILKKLTLHLHKDCSTNDELVKKLLKIPRGSTKCEVVFFDWGKK